MLMQKLALVWKPTSTLSLLMKLLLVSLRMWKPMSTWQPVLSWKRAPKSTQEPSLQLLHRLPPQLRRQRHCRYRHPRRKQPRAVLQLASPTSCRQLQMQLPLFLHPLCYEQLGL